MKGRYRTAAFFVVIALLATAASGFSINLGNPSGSSVKRKPTKGENRVAPELAPDHTYIVRRGDSLIKIARAFGTTPEALISGNELKSTKIIIGQALKIPFLQDQAAQTQLPQTTEMEFSPKEPVVNTAVPQPEDLARDLDGDTQPMRLRLVEAGFKLIGVRYRFSGGSEKTGFDCSGLVKSLFSKFNIDLPRSSREQYKQGEKIERDKLEAGDLVFFSSGGKIPTHVGIYIGNNKFLHAARKAQQVIVSDLNKIWYTMRYLGARRIMDLWWEEPESTSESN